MALTKNNNFSKKRIKFFSKKSGKKVLFSDFLHILHYNSQKTSFKRGGEGGTGQTVSVRRAWRSVGKGAATGVAQRRSKQKKKRFFSALQPVRCKAVRLVAGEVA